MGYKDIKSGDKVAKPTAARFIKAKTGTLGMEVSFEFTESGSGTLERLSWVGWLSSSAMENTMETLVNVLGFSGNDSCDDNGVLSDPNALVWDRQVKLVVELETYNGKDYPKIKWVNSLSGSAYSTCAPTVMKASIEASGFRAAFLAAKQAKSGVSEDKVPF